MNPPKVQEKYKKDDVTELKMATMPELPRFNEQEKVIDDERFIVDTRFKYGDYIVVNKGFYKGIFGHVIDFRYKAVTEQVGSYTVDKKTTSYMILFKPKKNWLPVPLKIWLPEDFIRLPNFMGW